MELTKKQLTYLICTFVICIVCGYKVITDYITWLVIESQIPSFMLIMIIGSVIIMTITLISEIHIITEDNVEVKEELHNEIPNGLCNE